MMFAQVTTQNVIDGFGLPAAIVILSLAAVVIILARLLKKSYDDRITDAKELGTRILEPLENISDMSRKSKELNEKIYEQLLSGGK